MTMANVIATKSCKTFSNNSYPKLPEYSHLWSLLLFLYFFFYFRTKSLGSFCILQPLPLRLWLANFPVFRWVFCLTLFWGIFFGGAKGEGELWGGLILFAVRFYSPTAIKQFLSALKCVYMWLGGRGRGPACPT